MDYPTVCRIQAASAILGGIILLLVPGPLLSVFLATTPEVELVARMLGGILFALGSTLPGAAQASDPGIQARVANGNALCDGFIAFILAVGTWQGQLYRPGWGLALLFAGNCLSWLGARARLGRPAA